MLIETFETIATETEKLEQIANVFSAPITKAAMMMIIENIRTALVKEQRIKRWNINPDIQ